MGLFDNLLKEVSEADREVFKKYPKLAEQIDQTDAKVTEWEVWRDNHWDPQAKMTKNAVEILQQKDAEIEALKLLQVGDMNWDEMKSNVEALMDQRLKSQRYQTPDDVKKLMEAELNGKVFVKQGDRQVPVTEYAQNLERGMEYLYFNSVDLPMKYLREFGTEAPDFTLQKVADHMREKGIPKFEDGYNSFVAPLRQKKAEELTAAKEAQIRQEERDKVKQEYAMRQGALPIDDQGSSPVTTPLQQRIAARQKKAEENGAPKLTPGSLGDNVAANDAYQQYLKDQAAGVKPAWPIQ